MTWILYLAVCLPPEHIGRNVGVLATWRNADVKRSHTDQQGDWSASAMVLVAEELREHIRDVVVVEDR